MMHLAKEMVSDSGMSAPAWAFFTTLISVIGLILRELIKTRNQTVERLIALETRFARFEKKFDRLIGEDTDTLRRPRKPRR